MNTKSNIFKEFCIIDFETTALDFRKAKIIDLGWAVRLEEDEEWKASTFLINPEEPIDPEISSITSITNRMVKDANTLENVKPLVMPFFSHYEYFVAHNAQYDQEVAKRQLELDGKWICTMRLAKKALANEENVKNFTLSYLRYRLDLDVPDEVTSHRADADSFVTAKLFEYLVNRLIESGDIDATLSIGPQIEAILNKPIIIKKMPFGKYKGYNLTDVPVDYWKWAVVNMKQLDDTQDEFNPDLAASILPIIEKALDLS